MYICMIAHTTHPPSCMCTAVTSKVVFNYSQYCLIVIAHCLPLYTHTRIYMIAHTTHLRVNPTAMTSKRVFNYSYYCLTVRPDADMHCGG